MQETKIAILEFEEVREEYRRKDAIGIPMSVREWYEKALSEMRGADPDTATGKERKEVG